MTAKSTDAPAAARFAVAAEERVAVVARRKDGERVRSCLAMS